MTALITDCKNDASSATGLTPAERQTLLCLARQAVQAAASGTALPEPDPVEFSPRLAAPGVVFVTLTRQGELRGCVGALEAYQPLVLDVCEHAAAAARRDFRFFPVLPEELPEIQIEISRLTAPQPLEYSQPQDLPDRLRPGVDGVVLVYQGRRATFLPQVWEKLPDPEEFLSHLCMKMGAAAELWRQTHLEVRIYQVEEFHE